MMQLCRPDGTVAQTLVSKRQGDTYRAARDADWGDTWPEPEPEPQQPAEALHPTPPPTG
jgi:ribosomal protein RSM22 (predicted rRNA methylase)